MKGKQIHMSKVISRKKKMRESDYLFFEPLSFGPSESPNEASVIEFTLGQEHIKQKTSKD